MTSEPRTVGFRRGERNVFFHLLTGCNLRCRHCYINKEQHGSEMLPFATISSWLQLFSHQEKKTNLVLLGGEPTLHPDLAKCISIAKKLHFNVTVDTNGYLFHNLLEKSSPELLDYLSFSLDGPDAEVNDSIRGKGAFDVCTGNLKKALAMGYKAGVIYTVNQQNIAHLHRMVPLLSSLGVRRFFIQVIGLRGNSAETDDCSDDQAWQVDRKRWLETVPQVARRCAQQGIHVTYPKVYLEKEETFECAGLVAENYFIFPNGRVYTCPLCEDYPLHSYRIEDNQLKKLDGLTEQQLFTLEIAEGCVMNKLLQPGNIEYMADGRPEYAISCCLLKNEMG